MGGKVYFGPRKPTIMHIRLLLALPVAFALGCTPSLEEVHVEDLKDSCDCLEAVSYTHLTLPTKRIV